MKVEKQPKRFNKNQVDYLDNKFKKGEKSGQKEDPAVVAESMLLEKTRTDHVGSVTMRFYPFSRLQVTFRGSVETRSQVKRKKRKQQKKL